MAGQVHGRVGLAAQEKRERIEISHKARMRTNTEKNSETMHQIAAHSTIECPTRLRPETQ